MNYYSVITKVYRVVPPLSMMGGVAPHDLTTTEERYI